MQRLFNSRLQEYKTPLGAVPAGQPVRLALTLPADLDSGCPHLVLTKDGELPVPYQMEREKEGRYSVTLTLPQAGLYFYYFDLYKDFQKLFCGSRMEAELAAEGEPWQLTVYEADFRTPQVLRGSVMYQIFPDRFCEGVPDKPMPFADRVYREDKLGEPYFWPTENPEGWLNLDYYGGDFAGIQKKLPYLQGLGVTLIYLNPIFEAHANHRYNTANYKKADPLLGTNEEFATLCAEANKCGIRIILDGVFSHTGSDSIYFNREGRYGIGGAYHDENSIYRHWYDFSDQYESGYRCWWGFPTLPEVDEDNPDYREYICGKGGVIDTWLSLGASGFRLDVADELPDDFIEALRVAVKAHGEDKYLLGEVWEDATTKEAYGHRRTYLLGKGLDAVMNYPFRSAVLNYVKSGEAEVAAEGILSVCEHYPAPALAVLMNFLSTHDTERILTAIAGEPVDGHDRYWQSGRRLGYWRYETGLRKVALAYAMIYTLPGIPSLYYGDEIGMQGYKDPFNRGYFDWDSTEERLRPQLAHLAELRRECDAFWGTDFTVVQAKGSLLHYRRVGKTQTADMLFNCSDKLLAAKVHGKNTEVNPWGYTVLVDDNL